jgi:hypothetical protein
MISSFSVVSFMDDDDNVVSSSSELLSASVEKLGRPDVVTIGDVTTKGLWIRVAAGSSRKLLQLPGRRLCCAT